MTEHDTQAGMNSGVCHRCFGAGYAPADNQMKMATVIDGPYKGKTVNIEIEAVDTLAGMCRCDLGGDKGTVLIRPAHLRKWKTVESYK